MSNVGFFTLGVTADRYSLPHPRLDISVILVIRRVLFRAFTILRDQKKFNLVEATEDQVTAALRSTIENNLRQTGEVRGFSKRSFETVIRQGQWANFDGTRITKTPDIFFKLRNDDSEPLPVLSEFDGLFVEAKPVDAVHAVGSKYCDEGLIRFVRGDYAWAMQEGMMLAYARDGRSIESHLIPAMREKKRMKSLNTSQLPKSFISKEAVASTEAESIYISIHPRNFQWPDGKGQATEITVYHLWYRCEY